MDCQILVPVRYAAWLSGDLGKNIEASLQARLRELPVMRLTRLPRGFLVSANEEPGILLETVGRAVQGLENEIQEEYPVFHSEMGPVWTGTLQAVFGPTTRSIAASE